LNGTSRRSISEDIGERRRLATLNGWQELDDKYPLAYNRSL